MKTTIAFAALTTTVVSLALAPVPQIQSTVERHVHLPDAGEPSVDSTSTRGQWVSSYSNKKNDPHGGPTVDETSTRGQWVSSYSNKNDPHGGPTVDETSTRGRWVSSYPNRVAPSKDATLDRGSTRLKWESGKWMASHAVETVDHWLPTGPGHLNIDDLEVGYKAHLMIMHDSDSWLQSGLHVVRRFFNDEAE